jgi:hypothetical protein
MPQGSICRTPGQVPTARKILRWSTWALSTVAHALPEHHACTYDECHFAPRISASHLKSATRACPWRFGQTLHASVCCQLRCAGQWLSLPLGGLTACAHLARLVCSRRDTLNHPQIKGPALGGWACCKDPTTSGDSYNSRDEAVGYKLYILFPQGSVLLCAVHLIAGHPVHQNSEEEDEVPIGQDSADTCNEAPRKSHGQVRGIGHLHTRSTSNLAWVT